jgi:putative heme-binding domain-containing protein
MIYRRTELACITCHAIGGVGGKVGPDMTSLGASAPIDYIIQSLYDPNAKIKENYHSMIVANEDGQTFTGIQVSSTDEELILRDATGKLIRIPADEVVATKNGKSLMPTGVIDRLSEQDQVDLISFITKLGKPGDFDAGKGGVARVYQILAGTHRVEQQGADRIISGERTEGWLPLWSLVDGSLPGQQLKEMTKPSFNISLVNVYARTEVEASRDGPVTFAVDGVDKASLWVDGKPVDGKTKFEADLTAGKHTVLVRLDGRSLPEAFKLRSKDVTFATE